MFSRYICITFSLLLSLVSSARVMGIDGGAALTDKYITALCKDSRGLMWIGTKQGLCTFDGSHFETLGSPLQSGNAIVKLIYDKASQRIWVGTEKGVYAVESESRGITPVVSKDKWSFSPVADICMLSGRLMVAFKSGEVASAGKDGRLTFLARMLQQDGKRYFDGSILPQGSNAVNLQPWGKSPPYILNTETRQLLRHPGDTAKGTSYLRKTYSDSIYICRAGGGLEIRNVATYAHLIPDAMERLRSFDNIIDVWPVSSGRFYLLCKPSNLYYVDLPGRHTDTISSEVFMGRLSTCFFTDMTGILWVGTNKGLVKITRDRKLFTHMLSNQVPVSIRSLAQDESGHLYAGTYSGLFRLASGESSWRIWSGMLPYAMLNLPGKYLYFVGEQPALYRVDKQSLKAETRFYTTQDLPPDELRQAYAMAVDGQGLAWIGTSYGLATYSPATKLLSAFKAPGLPPNLEVRYIRVAPDHHLWICTRSGLYDLDPGSGSVWHASMSTTPALTSNTVNYIDQDSSGALWLCTDGGGINIVDKDRKSVTALRTEDGLSDNTTYQLLWQNSGRIWISTFNGLSTYDLHSRSFYNYYVEDGLTNNEFNHNAFLREPSGRMLFGGINGINAFYPDSITQETRFTRLFASTITKWDSKAGTLINLPPGDSMASITLEPLDHSLTFNLALTDYHSPENEIFLYRIRGLFDEWVSLNSQRSLRLDGLAAGSYTLEIKALDSRGAPATNILRYKIVVAQPFYKSWWFYLLLFVLASALLSSFFFLRLQNIRRVLHLREQIASDLHDEVGSLLTRITMTSDNLRYSNHSEIDRTTKLQKIAALSRTAASSMSDILWAIDARNDYTGNLADRMREHAEEMLAPLNIHPHFDFVVNQRMSISSLLRQQLYLIYKEAINNIVKHSQATDVNILYHHNDQRFELRIVNDGYQEKEKSSTKGQGLKNIRMRAAKIHATTRIAAEGDTFRVEIGG